ncbi:MAG: hypothetical protein V3W45_00985 [Sedimentisphaerales bacterium]
MNSIIIAAIWFKTSYFCVEIDSTLRRFDSAHRRQAPFGRLRTGRAGKLTTGGSTLLTINWV